MVRSEARQRVSISTLNTKSGWSFELHGGFREDTRILFLQRKAIAFSDGCRKCQSTRLEGLLCLGHFTY